jgi:biotin transport system substrate-specific component
MAYIIGRFADGGASKRIVPLALAMIAADAVSFAFGFIWLMVVANMILQSGGELPKWLAGGDLLTVAWNGAVQPFILWDILKMAFAAVTVAGAWRMLSKKA